MQNSPGARIFVLIHKMDLVPEENRDKVRHAAMCGAQWRARCGTNACRAAQVFRDRASLVQSCSRGADVTCFRTSIWDETLYKVRTALAAACCVPRCADAGRRRRPGPPLSTPSFPTSACWRATCAASAPCATRTRW